MGEAAGRPAASGHSLGVGEGDQNEGCEREVSFPKEKGMVMQGQRATDTASTNCFGYNAGAARGTQISPNDHHTASGHNMMELDTSPNLVDRRLVPDVGKQIKASWASIVEGSPVVEVLELQGTRITEMAGEKVLFIPKEDHETLKKPFRFAAIATLSGGAGRNRLDYGYIFSALRSQWQGVPNLRFTSAGKDLESKVTHVQHHDFIKEHSLAIKASILSWLHSFLKQFYSSITKLDYITLRWGFIMMHCRGNPQFNFHGAMVRAYEADFKKVVGISWYQWGFVIVFLLINVRGWNTFFWITFLPFILLLAVGTKLEHVITQLAKEVAEKHTAIEGDLVVQPSDDHFWFHKPRLVLYLIHFILFQNAFEIAFFFWLWITYGFHSCLMGKVGFVVPRLILGVIIQVLCSFSTLPLYPIVTLMGSSFKKAIFDDHVQENLIGWAHTARVRQAVRPTTNQASPAMASYTHAGNRSPDEIQLQEAPLVHSVPNRTS